MVAKKTFCTVLFLTMVLAVSARHAHQQQQQQPRRQLADLPSITSLPDPFAFQNGTRISTKAQWSALSAEHSALLQQYEMGVKPPVPADVVGSLSNNNLTVKVTVNGKSITFYCSITYPTSSHSSSSHSSSSSTTTRTRAAAPYPAIIGIGGVSLDAAMISALGIATIVFPNNAIAAQDSASSRGIGLFYDLYGTDHTAGAMIAWAWGVDCLITALEQTAATNKIDVKHLATTGCSRNGKGALVAAAFNERVALALPQESGAGGAGAWRVLDAMTAQGIKVQTLAEIVTENVWFAKSFADFTNKTTQLPFDHHVLSAMMAPRALLFIENTGIDWLGGYAGWVQASAARKVFDALEIGDNFGFTGVSHSDHCAFQSTTQGPALKAYLQRFLLEQSGVNTTVMSTGSNSTIEPDWMPWTVPQLTGSNLASHSPKATGCFASAVDAGSTPSHLIYALSVAQGRHIKQAKVVSAGQTFALNHLPGQSHHGRALFAGAKFAHAQVHVPFVIEVTATDGGVSRVLVTAFADKTEFAACA